LPPKFSNAKHSVERDGFYAVFKAKVFLRDADGKRAVVLPREGQQTPAPGVQSAFHLHGRHHAVQLQNKIHLALVVVGVFLFMMRNTYSVIWEKVNIFVFFRT